MAINIFAFFFSLQSFQISIITRWRRVCWDSLTSFFFFVFLSCKISGNNTSWVTSIDLIFSPVNFIWLLQLKNYESHLQIISSVNLSMGTAAGAWPIEIHVQCLSILKILGRIWYFIHPLNPSVPPVPTLFFLTPHCWSTPFHHLPSPPLPSGWLNHVFWPGGLLRVQDLVTAPFSQSSSAQSRVAGRMEPKIFIVYSFPGFSFSISSHYWRLNINTDPSMRYRISTHN